MNCVSSKTADRKAKRGKTSSKKKSKMEKSAGVEEIPEVTTELVADQSEKNEDAHESLELDIEGQIKNTEENEQESVTELNKAIPMEQGDVTDQRETVEEKNNVEDGEEMINSEGASAIPKCNRSSETISAAGASDTHGRKDLDDHMFDESCESDFIMIELPGETNDDLSDTKSIKIAEPLSELVDGHAMGLVLKEYIGFCDSDMEVTSDLLLQYLNRDQRKLLKVTVRKAGWPVTDKIRQTLWKTLSQHLHKADTDEVFKEYEETLFTDGFEIRIPSFVDAQHMYNYYLNEDGVTAARKILGVLEVTKPDIVYCPMLYQMVCLFLHFMDAPECYNCVYALLRNPTFVSQTKVCYEASKLVMRDLAKKHAKSSYIYLVRNSANIDAVFDSWLWWILTDLPFQYVVRVFDCYLVEGVKVLYRVILSILIQFAKSQGKKSSFSRPDSSGNSAIVSSLRQFCREISVPIDKFLKTGFGVRGLRRSDIQKLQIKHEMYLNSQRHTINNQDGDNRIPISRSFSGPIILQNVASNTLTADLLLAVWTWLPTRYAVCQPELLYTSEEHGTSLVTLYQRVENHQPTIIVIKTTNDEIFGAFCSTYWKERRSQFSNHLSYFGTGETFIFTLSPEKKKYQWVGLSGESIPNTANMFQAGDRSILTIGGGHGEAICLDENLLHCRTEKCDTFNNEPLSKDEDFMCKVVEVYGFQ